MIVRGSIRSCTCRETLGTSNDVRSVFPAHCNCGSRCGSYAYVFFGSGGSSPASTSPTSGLLTRVLPLCWYCSIRFLRGMCGSIIRESDEKKFEIQNSESKPQWQLRNTRQPPSSRLGLPKGSRHSLLHSPANVIRVTFAQLAREAVCFPRITRLAKCHGGFVQRARSDGWIVIKQGDAF